MNQLETFEDLCREAIVQALFKVGLELGWTEAQALFYASMWDGQIEVEKAA